MPNRRTDEPFALTSYAASLLRKRFSQAESALKEAHAWIGNMQDSEGEAVFVALAHIKRVRRLSARVERSLEEAAIAQMHHDGQVYRVGDGYTAVLRPAQERRGWNNQAVMHDLEEAIIEKLTASNPAVPRSAVRAIAREALWSVHRAGRIEWRSTSLRDMGLDPDTYSTHVSVPESIDMRGTTTHAKTRGRKDMP